MGKEIKPGVAAAIIVAVVLVIGVFIYTRSVGFNGKPLKPTDALKDPGFKDKFRAAYDAKYGSH